MKQFVLGLAFSCALSGAAFAQQSGMIVLPELGAAYFNRPGETLETHRAALEACRADVAPLMQPYPNSAGASGAAAAGGLAGALVGTAMDAQAQTVATLKAMHANYENCMVVRGWRVVQLDAAHGAQLDELEPDALAARLASMVGSETPEGRVVRSFSNEVAERGTTLYAPPRTPQTISLSLQLLPESYLEIPTRANRRPMSAMTSDEIREQAEERRETQAAQRAQREALLGRDRRFARATDADDLAGLAADATLVVIRVYGDAGAGVVLVRTDAENDRDDSILAQAPVPRRRDPSRERTLVFAVPPGHWRVTAMTPSVQALTSFCLGAPSFDVAAGEAVFAGSFGFGATGPRLEMALEPARAALAGAPAVAERLRAATYTNGETFQCGAPGSYLYAYEIADAPFRDGYAMGSRAQPAPAAPATIDASAAAPVEQAPQQ